MAVEIAPRIAVDPSVRFGKPMLKSTRVPVELVIGNLAGGMTVDAAIEEYEITLEDIQAALGCASSPSSYWWHQITLNARHD
ncbi:MAG: DUF433 domain-containing protein [Ardenticatenia bacterium]|nr:DUF433 domain-containing protein [Ardenticatenia bacterium]